MERNGRSGNVSAGQVWADAKAGASKLSGLDERGRPELGMPHFLVLIRSADTALLAPALRVGGRWVQHRVGEGDRLALPVSDLEGEGRYVLVAGAA
ncbi:hypothetical protein WV31_10285 [Magnetospirillum sp. ME-1]|nr:hypothetical protein WV31_10285 [Magnetospirillum sp. ME-1]